MKLADLTGRAGEWLRGGGPMEEVAISSRVRLARNLAGVPFLSKCSRQQQEEIEGKLRESILAAQIANEVFYIRIDTAGEIDRQLLVERHLISKQHANEDHPRGVAISGNEKLAIMVNEEDHLRIQVLRSGLQLMDAMEEIDRIDDLLEQQVDYAFHSHYGYLTACPTNVGTGLRVSVMLHLPALKMTGEIEKAFRAARDMHLAIRGLYGEGTEATGDFFQISNQITLGRSEQQIVQEFHDEIVPHFIAYELSARRGLMEKRRVAIEDKVFRALEILRSARLVSSEETMYLLSLVRLGVNLSLVQNVSLKTINELFLMTQPSHLQRILSREMSPEARAEARSTFIRDRLAAN